MKEIIKSAVRIIEKPGIMERRRIQNGIRDKGQACGNEQEQPFGANPVQQHKHNLYYKETGKKPQPARTKSVPDSALQHLDKLFLGNSGRNVLRQCINNDG